VGLSGGLLVVEERAAERVDAQTAVGGHFGDEHRVGVRVLASVQPFGLGDAFPIVAEWAVDLRGDAALDGDR
jgi:hypothetical protein